MRSGRITSTFLRLARYVSYTESFFLCSDASRMFVLSMLVESHCRPWSYHPIDPMGRKGERCSCSPPPQAAPTSSDSSPSFGEVKVDASRVMLNAILLRFSDPIEIAPTLITHAGVIVDTILQVVTPRSRFRDQNRLQNHVLKPRIPTTPIICAFLHFFSPFFSLL